eukprot:m.65489 g.65489  ORF g.65489 m.65489 type:complete len:95 (-) comp9761_c0_seq2:64-348(-)
MGFSLGALFEAGLLVINGIAVLQDFSPPLPEDPDGKPVPRFLALYGLAENKEEFGESASVKSKLIHVINAVRTLMRMPLIFVNTAAIIYLFLLG